MEAILRKERLAEWAAALAGQARVCGPALVEDVWGFGPVDAGAAPVLDHGNTTRPPKNFAFPQREVLYRFRLEPGWPPKIESAVPSPETTVVFGVRPCDGRAMVRNDLVFACGPVDPYYQSRREKLVLVGLACNAPPSPNCFCKSVGGSPHSEDGLDLIMTELPGRYYVKALSRRGAALLENSRGLFDGVGPEETRQVQQAHAAALDHPQRSIAGMEQVSAGLKRNFDSPKWQELARACIGCGACTYLCPSCHCFDINDELKSQSPAHGERVRTWDNCQFPDFTMHASGHNPRPDTGARLRQRVCHKLLYFVENHRMQQCTGCGRCISHCPVGIDIVRVTHEVAEA